jgi:23S rRNA maturation-related 3'-5' exoribonuclease YhaM
MSNTKEAILDLLGSVKREGVENLIKHLEGSPFFTDPASVNHHNAYEGGLADHSLNVFQVLENFRKLYPELEELEESVKIIGLLHDIGYVGCYQKTTKNVPMKGADGKNKKNEYGKLIFIEKEGFDFYPEAQLPYPPGHLSTLLIKQHMKLTKLEDLAIHWQRGIYDQPQHLWFTVDRAVKKHKLIMLTQFAKRESSLFYDKKVE